MQISRTRLRTAAISVITSATGLTLWMVMASAATMEIVMPAKSHAPSARAATVSMWIRNLNSSHTAVRTAAHEHLLAMGEPAIRPLEAALHAPATPLMRRQFRSVLDGISSAEALRGPLVTLQMKNATLGSVITRLCSLVGFQADLYPQFRSGALIPAYFDQERLTVDVRRQPFWLVIRRLAMATDVGPSAGSPMSTTLPFGRGCSVFQKGAPVDISGAFLIAIQSCALKRLAQFDLGQRHRNRSSLQVRYDVLWCPDHGTLSRIGPLTVLQAMDNTGKSLCTLPRRTQMRDGYTNISGASWGQQTGFTFVANLKWPVAMAKTIAILRGEIAVVAPTGPITYRLENLASVKASIFVRGTRLQFGKPVRDTGSKTATPSLNWKVSLNIDDNMLDQRSGPQFAALVPQITNGNALVFYDSKGKALSSAVKSNGGGIGPHLHYDFEITGGKPVSLRLIVHRRVAAELEVPFMFRNIPLPQ